MAYLSRLFEGVRLASSSDDEESPRGRNVHGCAQTTMLENAKVVDTLERCRAACKDLCREAKVAVDIEGVDLCRVGEICIIQAAKEDGATYLFDIVTLGSRAFSKGDLKGFLENQTTVKIVYDGRADADALYHQFGVRLFDGRVCDVQYLYCKTHDSCTDNYVKGLAKAMQRAYWISGGERRALDDVKDAGKRLFVPDYGGSYAVWKKRPMPRALILYAVADVWHLHEMAVRWGAQERPEVYRVTSARMRRAATGADVPKGRHMAIKDFS